MSTVNESSQNEQLEKTGRRWVVGANAAFFILTSIYFFVAFLIVFFEFNGADDYLFLGYVRDSIPSVVSTASLSSLQKPAETVLVFAWAWGAVSFLLIIMFTKFSSVISRVDIKELVKKSGTITSVWIFRLFLLVFPPSGLYVFYIKAPENSGKVESISYNLLTSSSYGVVPHGAFVSFSICISLLAICVLIFDFLKLMKKGD